MPLNVTSDVVYEDPRFPQADHPNNKGRRNKVILNSTIEREKQKIGGLDPSSQGFLFLLQSLSELGPADQQFR